MARKTKIITFGLIGAVILLVVLNYVSSEFFSLKYWNPIKRVFFKNVLVKAEAVSSKEKIEQGLAWRKELPAGRGMLFVMPANDFQRFWMKGMQFSIDIIWIENNRVIGCEERISPEDQRIFTSPGKASLVLEVEKGFCGQYQVQVNDLVRIQ